MNDKVKKIIEAINETSAAEFEDVITACAAIATKTAEQSGDPAWANAAHQLYAASTSVSLRGGE